MSPPGSDGQSRWWTDLGRWLRGVWGYVRRLVGAQPAPAPAIRQLLIKFSEGEELQQVERSGKTVLLYGSVDITAEFERRGILTPTRALRQSFPHLVQVLRSSKRLGRATLGPGPNSSRSLDLFVRLSFTDRDDRVTGVMTQIRALDQWVEWVVPVLPLANEPPQIPDYEPEQGYLNRAVSPAGRPGIDARYAWGVAEANGYNGRGKGIKVCDLEKGYYSGHDNLPDVAHVDPDSTLVSDDPGLYHGTKTIGVLGSPKAGDVGTIGICPEATIVFSPVGGDYTTVDVHAAVEMAILNLRAGDVLVVESQLIIDNENDRLRDECWAGGDCVEILVDEEEPTLIPVEANPDVLEAFVRAAEAGITVVEAAGNSGYPLTKVVSRYTVAESSFDVTMWSPEEDESLAILVGSGDPDDHSRVTGNYGSRVNCQGWGRGVYAPTTAEDSDRINDDENNWDNNWYTAKFSDTSSATAIIGGLVTCLQGAWRASNEGFLDPIRIRELVGCPELGSPDPGGEIGPLPDLHRILCHLEIECPDAEDPLPPSTICPDVFVRDYLADVGNAEPTFMAGMYPTLRNRSPDILLRAESLTDPDVEFGAATWTVEKESGRAEPGENLFYVRAANRGSGPDGAEIEIYVSDPSPFLHPRYWQLVATTQVDEVLPRSVAVAPAATWDASFLSEATPYSLIVRLKPHRRAGPEPDDSWSSAEFRRYAAGTNDVCFRSVQTVTAPPDGMARFRCHLRGVPEGPRDLSLRFVSSLPAGTQVTITPHGNLDCNTDPALSLVDGVASTVSVASLALEYAFPTNVDVAVDLEVDLDDVLPGRYETTVDQWDGGSHLGRITFVVVVQPWLAAGPPPG